MWELLQIGVLNSKCTPKSLINNFKERLNKNLFLELPPDLENIIFAKS